MYRFNSYHILYDVSNAEDAMALSDILHNRRAIFCNHIYNLVSLPEDYDVSYPPFPLFLPKNSVIIGLSECGLLAAKIQDTYPELNLSVVAVNSLDTGIASSKRLSLYSSAYLKDKLGTSQAYDLPWLEHGLRNVRYGLAYLLDAYMKQEDISDWVEQFNEVKRQGY